MRYVGIDVGGTNLKAGLVDEEGHIMEVERIPLAFRDPEQFAGTVADLAVTVARKGGVAVSASFCKAAETVSRPALSTA